METRGLIDALRRYDNLLALEYEDGISDEEFNAVLDTVAREVADNVDEFADYMERREERAALIKAYIDNGKAALKRHENGTERIKNAAAYYLSKSGQKAAYGLIRRVSLRHSEQTVIDDANRIPSKYQRQKISTEPDKAAIKEAIKAGEVVPGAHVEIRQNLVIM